MSLREADRKDISEVTDSCPITRLITIAMVLLFLAHEVRSEDQADQQPALTEQQWKQLEEDSKQPTEDRIDEIRQWLRDYGDKVRETKKNKNYDDKQRREHLAWLKEQRDAMHKELKDLRSGDLITIPCVLPPQNIGDIGTLNFRKAKSYPILKMKALEVIDGKNMVVYFEWQQAIIDIQKGGPVGYKTVTEGPFWITNAITQVKDAGGVQPSAEGAFIVVEPVEYHVAGRAQKTIPRLKAFDLIKEIQIHRQQKKQQMSNDRRVAGVERQRPPRTNSQQIVSELPTQ